MTTMKCSVKLTHYIKYRSAL